MKVLHVSPSVSRRDGGPAEVIRGLIPALIARGIDAEVLATSKGWDTQDGDLETAKWLHTEPSYGPSSLTFSSRLARKIRREVSEFDLVHVHGLQSHPGTVAMNAARAAGVPYVIEPHGALDEYHWRQHRARKRTYRLFFDHLNWRGAAGAVYSSTVEATHGRRLLRGVTDHLVPLGVDQSLFEIDREKLTGPPVVLYLGRITEKKRLDLVLAAMLQPALSELGAELVIAGAPDGTLRVDPLAFVKQNGLEPKVTFLGGVDSAQRRQLLAHASVFVLPSEDESFGVAVAEAMAADVPVVTTLRVGLAPAAFAAGALRVADLTARSVAAQIADAISSPSGVSPREYARSNFTWDKSATMLADSYERILTERRRPLVLVTQPYLPAYRVPLFDAVESKLSSVNVDLSVASGSPVGAQADRKDQRSASWRIPIRETGFPVAKWRVLWRSVRSYRKPTVIVSELEALNLFAWKALFGRARLVLWGHGKPYVNDVPRLAEWLEWALARRAAAVMTYSDGGREYLVSKGRVRPEKVHSIGNSTDSASLRTSVLSIGDERKSELRAKFGEGLIALYIGGLDDSKRIDFLLAAARFAAQSEPTFKLIVAGNGTLGSLVLAAEQDGLPVFHVGDARGEDLAELAVVSEAIWIPGRVGLVAVDAIALGLPVFTTEFTHHAPEIEFLEANEIRYLPDDPREYAVEALRAMNQSAGVQRTYRSDFPTVDKVADRFVAVVTSFVVGNTKRRE